MKLTDVKLVFCFLFYSLLYVFVYTPLTNVFTISRWFDYLVLLMPSLFSIGFLINSRKFDMLKYPLYVGLGVLVALAFRGFSISRYPSMQIGLYTILLSLAFIMLIRNYSFSFSLAAAFLIIFVGAEYWELGIHVKEYFIEKLCPDFIFIQLLHLFSFVMLYRFMKPKTLKWLLFPLPFVTAIAFFGNYYFGIVVRIISVSCLIVTFCLNNRLHSDKT